MPPPLMSARPTIVEIRVVLPTPFRPSTANVSPAGNSNEMSVMTWVAPHPELTRSQARRTPPLATLVSAMMAMPQIDVADKAVRCNLLRGTLDHDLSRYKHADPLREARNQLHVMLDEQD